MLLFTNVKIKIIFDLLRVTLFLVHVPVQKFSLPEKKYFVVLRKTLQGEMKKKRKRNDNKKKKKTTFKKKKIGNDIFSPLAYSNLNSYTSNTILQTHLQNLSNSVQPNFPITPPPIETNNVSSSLPERQVLTQTIDNPVTVDYDDPDPVFDLNESSLEDFRAQEEINKDIIERLKAVSYNDSFSYDIVPELSLLSRIKLLRANYKRYFESIYSEIYDNPVDTSEVKEFVQRLTREPWEHSGTTVFQVCLRIFVNAITYHDTKNRVKKELKDLHELHIKCNLPKTFDTLLSWFKGVGLVVYTYRACKCGRYLHVGENTFIFSFCPFCKKPIDQEKLIVVYDIPLCSIIKMMYAFNKEFINSLHFDYNTLKNNFQGTELLRMLNKLERDNKKIIGVSWGLDGLGAEEGSTKEFPEKWCNIFEFSTMDPKKRLKYSNLILSTLTYFGKTFSGIDYVMIPKLYEFSFAYSHPMNLYSAITKEVEEVYLILFLIFCDKEAKKLILQSSGWAGYYGCFLCDLKGEKNGRKSGISFNRRDSRIKTTNYYNYFGLCRFLDLEIESITPSGSYNVTGISPLSLYEIEYMKDWIKRIPIETMHVFFNKGVIHKIIKNMIKKEKLNIPFIKNPSIFLLNSRYFSGLRFFFFLILKESRPLLLKSSKGKKSIHWKLIGKYILYPIVLERFAPNVEEDIPDENRRRHSVLVDLVRFLQNSIRAVDTYHPNYDVVEFHTCKLFDHLVKYFDKFEITTKMHNVSELKYFVKWIYSLKYCDAFSYESLLSDIQRFHNGGRDNTKYIINLIMMQTLIKSFKNMDETVDLVHEERIILKNKIRFKVKDDIYLLGVGKQIYFEILKYKSLLVRYIRGKYNQNYLHFGNNFPLDIVLYPRLEFKKITYRSEMNKELSTSNMLVLANNRMYKVDKYVFIKSKNKAIAIANEFEFISMFKDTRNMRMYKCIPNNEKVVISIKKFTTPPPFFLKFTKPKGYNVERTILTPRIISNGRNLRTLNHQQRRSVISSDPYFLSIEIDQEDTDYFVY